MSLEAFLKDLSIEGMDYRLLVADGLKEKERQFSFKEVIVLLTSLHPSD